MSERPQENKRERKGSNDGVGGTLNSSFKHCAYHTMGKLLHLFKHHAGQCISKGQCHAI